LHLGLEILEPWFTRVALRVVAELGYCSVLKAAFVGDLLLAYLYSSPE